MAGSNIMSAGGDAGQHGGGVIEAEQFAKAKTGIEMVARASRDQWFGGKGSLDQ